MNGAGGWQAGRGGEATLRIRQLAAFMEYFEAGSRAKFGGRPAGRMNEQLIGGYAPALRIRGNLPCNTQDR